MDPISEYRKSKTKLTVDIRILSEAPGGFGSPDRGARKIEIDTSR